MGPGDEPRRLRAPGQVLPVGSRRMTGTHNTGKGRYRVARIEDEVPGSELVVLGIDPGTKHTGYGVVREEGRTETLIKAGTISPSGKTESFAARLREIHREVAGIIQTHRPDEVAVEEGFFHRNARSALETGAVRGVVLLAAAEAGLPVEEYGPGEVRQSVVGRGGATKDQVAFMVRGVLGELPAEIDAHATDALAVALCHLRRRGWAATRQEA